MRHWNCNWVQVLTSGHACCLKVSRVRKVSSKVNRPNIRKRSNSSSPLRWRSPKIAPKTKKPTSAAQSSKTLDSKKREKCWPKLLFITEKWLLTVLWGVAHVLSQFSHRKGNDPKLTGWCSGWLAPITITTPWPLALAQLIFHFPAKWINSWVTQKRSESGP